MKYGKQHKQSYNTINSFSLYYHGKTETILNYKCTFGLIEDKSTSVTRKWVQVSVNSTGGTVHLFIGTGRNLCKITFMPFMFTIDIRTIYQGLNSLFLFKSVPFLLLSRSFLAYSFGTGSTFIPTMLFILWTTSSQVRRFLYIYYTWETLLIMFLRTFGRRRPPTVAPRSINLLR